MLKSMWSLTGNLNLVGFPTFFISLLSDSSLPIGTLSSIIFGILIRSVLFNSSKCFISSSSFLISSASFPASFSCASAFFFSFFSFAISIESWLRLCLILSASTISSLHFLSPPISCSRIFALSSAPRFFRSLRTTSGFSLISLMSIITFRPTNFHIIARLI